VLGILQDRRFNGIFFRLAAVRHLGFLKFKFLTVMTVRRLISIISIIFTPGTKDPGVKNKKKTKIKMSDVRQVNWQSVVQKHGVEAL